LASAVELANEGKAATLRGQVIPAPDIFAPRNATAHAVGCAVINISHPQQLVNAVIIPKNTHIPCKKVDHFYLEREDQTVAAIKILQGEENVDYEECLVIGELRLENLPPEAKRTGRIRVEYIIDADGMVTATATDAVSGITQTVSVDYKKGITPRSKPGKVA